MSSRFHPLIVAICSVVKKLDFSCSRNTTKISELKLLAVRLSSMSDILELLFRPVDRDVFVRDLNRQLGTPSHWLPVDSCKKEDKEAP